jgi:hypothetical protein
MTFVCPHCNFCNDDNLFNKISFEYNNVDSYGIDSVKIRKTINNEIVNIRLYECPNCNCIIIPREIKNVND